MKKINLNRFNSTKAYLRAQTKQWKKDSLKKSKRCSITGNVNNLEVHHHNMSFNEIVKETFEMANLPYYEQTFKYTTEELTKVSSICLALHYKYGLGVAIAPRVHKALHDTYGPTVTPEQYKEFKTQYRASINIKANTSRKVK